MSKNRKTARMVSLSIDIVVPDVGRIQKRIGTDSIGRKNDYLAMVRALQREGRLDVLRNLREGVMTFALVYEAHNKGKLDALPSAETLIPLGNTWNAWMDDLRTAPVAEQISDEHLKAHRHSLARLLRELRTDASVADLPAALEAVRVTYRRKPRQFNKTIASARAFLRDTLRRRHKLYQECAAIPVLKWKRKRQPKPQSVAQLLSLNATLTPELYAVVWALATTGMLPKEYWFDGWTVHRDFISIDGQKRAARQRHIPDLGFCLEPQMGRDFAGRSLHALGVPFQLKDLRNTFMNWMEQAGVPRTRRRMYIGHGAKDVSDLYEQVEIAQFLREDGDRLRAWIAKQGAPRVTEEFDHHNAVAASRTTNILTLEKTG